MLYLWPWWLLLVIKILKRILNRGRRWNVALEWRIEGQASILMCFSRDASSRLPKRHFTCDVYFFAAVAVIIFIQFASGKHWKIFDCTPFIPDGGRFAINGRGTCGCAPSCVTCLVSNQWAMRGSCMNVTWCMVGLGTVKQWNTMQRAVFMFNYLNWTHLLEGKKMNVGRLLPNAMSKTGILPLLIKTEILTGWRMLDVHKSIVYFPHIAKKHVM